MPKTSKRSKRFGKKKKKAVQKISREEEIKQYEDTILELNRQLALKQTSVRKVESQNEQLENRLQSLGPDKEEIISYLKRTIELNAEEIQKLKAKVSENTKSLQNLDACKAELEQLEAEYKFMDEKLKSRINDLENRLVALDRVGLIRDEIMKNFNIQHKARQNRQDIYKEELYEAEKKLVLEKSRFKREIELRLESLINDYRSMMDVRISANTEKLVKSSIQLNIDYNDTIITFNKLEKKNKHLKEINQKLRLEEALTRPERNTVVNKCNVQLETITNLLESYEEVTEKINAYKTIETEVLELTKELSNLLSITKNLKENVKILEQNLHANRCKRNTLRTTLEYYTIEHDRLRIIADDCIQRVLYLLENQIIAESKQTKILHTIFAVVDLYQKEKTTPPKPKIVLSLSVMYKQGDFGFVPKPVHLVLPTKQNREVMLSPSFQKTLSEPTFSQKNDSETECESETTYT